MIRKLLPILDHLDGYNIKYLGTDVKAGLTVGTILIPQAMAYGLLAGVPPIYGLYAALVPLIIYALYASSSKLAVGPVAVSALLIYSGVSQLAEPGSSDYLSYVITAGLLIGLLQVLIATVRFGFLVNFLSHPVIAGFTSAAAVIIIMTQLNDAFGLSMESCKNCLSAFIVFLKELSHIHPITAGLTIGTIVLISVFKKISRKIPGAMLVVVGAIILSKLTDLQGMGVSIIGIIPSGFPRFQLPAMSIDIIRDLAPTVFAVTLIGIIESIGIAKALESKHKDHTVKPNQEFMALGLAKIAGSFLQAIPTSGSFSRSAINSANGARTPVSSIVSALLVGIALVFLTSAFHYLPKAVLAGIILMAVSSLFDIKEAEHLWKTNKKDLAMMVVTFILTLLFGIEEGVIAGVVLSLLMVLYKSSRPNVVELGNIPNSIHFKDLVRYDQAGRIDEMMILRFDHQLYFGNASFFRDRIHRFLKDTDRQIKYLLLDASHIDDIDSTGMHVLKDLDLHMKTLDIELHLCEASGPVRDSLHLSGLLSEAEKHHVSVNGAVESIQARKSGKGYISRSVNPLQTNQS